MSLPSDFLRVFGDYEFTKEFTKPWRPLVNGCDPLVQGATLFTKEFTKPAIILWRPLVNSVGASPVGLKRFPKTEEFTKPAITLSFPRVFEDYEFTKKL